MGLSENSKKSGVVNETRSGLSRDKISEFQNVNKLSEAARIKNCLWKNIWFPWLSQKKKFYFTFFKYVQKAIYLLSCSNKTHSFQSYDSFTLRKRHTKKRKIKTSDIFMFMNEFDKRRMKKNEDKYNWYFWFKIWDSFS